LTAYLIVLREQTFDESELKQYQRLARASFAGRSVRFHAAYGPIRVLEGAPVEAAVVLEFENIGAAEAWYFSPEYQDALRHRLIGSTSRALIVEGLPAA